MFRRSMVPLDGSARAEKAMPVAARLARASVGSVLLTQAAAIPIMYESYSAPSYMAEMIDAEIGNAQDYLKTMARVGALAGIPTETTALFGAAAQTLLLMASLFEADLVVMTSQGKAGMKRRVPGSVARHNPIPVLVLHNARTYMQSIVEHLREGLVGKLKLTLTWSVALSDDSPADADCAPRGDGFPEGR